MIDPSAEMAPLWSLCLAQPAVLRPHMVWSAWSLAPVILVPLVVYGTVCASGALRSAASPPKPGRTKLEVSAAAVSLTLLVIALLSPLCRLSATLAWAHMVQHFILVAIAPPLIVLAAPLRTIGWELFRYTSLGALVAIRWNRPIAATFLYGVVIWAWHVPAMYELALTGAVWHIVYLCSLLVASLWFWACVIHTTSFGVMALALLATMVHTGFLGALLTFAPWPLYSVMIPGAMAFGLSPIEDQQLAGLIMWVPMGMVYLLSALVVLGRELFAQPVDASAMVRRSD